jgi:hypothetical protein
MNGQGAGRQCGSEEPRGEKFVHVAPFKITDKRSYAAAFYCEKALRFRRRRNFPRDYRFKTGNKTVYRKGAKDAKEEDEGLMLLSCS